MAQVCSWCKQSKKLQDYKIAGEYRYHLCQECIDDYKNDRCITCKEPLYGQLTVNGECSGCQQVRAAKEEKVKRDMINALNIEALQEYGEAMEFTEEEYVQWLTGRKIAMEDGKRAAVRREWLKNKLSVIYGWSKEKINRHIDDIDYIIANNAMNVLSETKKFIVVNEDKIPSGINIIARKNNVLLVSIPDKSEE